MLKPCPFCGGSDILEDDWYMPYCDGFIYIIKCTKCKAKIFSSTSRIFSRKMWNARACDSEKIDRSEAKMELLKLISMKILAINKEHFFEIEIAIKVLRWIVEGIKSSPSPSILMEERGKEISAYYDSDKVGEK